MANLFDGYLVEACVGAAAPLLSVALGTLATRPTAGRRLAAWVGHVGRTALIWLPALGVFLATLGPVGLHESVSGPVQRQGFHVESNRGGSGPSLQHYLMVRTSSGLVEVSAERDVWARCEQGEQLTKAAWSPTVACDGEAVRNLGGFWLLMVAFLILALAPGLIAWTLGRGEQDLPPPAR